jgi:hypothetical protein
MKKKLCLLVIFLFVVVAVSGCGISGSKKEPDVKQPKLPEIQQGTVDHFPETSPSTKQTPAPKQEGLKEPQKKKIEFEQGSIDQFPEKK